MVLQTSIFTFHHEFTLECTYEHKGKLLVMDVPFYVRMALCKIFMKMVCHTNVSVYVRMDLYNSMHENCSYEYEFRMYLTNNSFTNCLAY